MVPDENRIVGWMDGIQKTAVKEPFVSSYADIRTAKRLRNGLLGRGLSLVNVHFRRAIHSRVGLLYPITVALYSPTWCGNVLSAT
jgi:hypothetical protein